MQLRLVPLFLAFLLLGYVSPLFAQDAPPTTPRVRDVRDVQVVPGTGEQKVPPARRTSPPPARTSLPPQREGMQNAREQNQQQREVARENLQELREENLEAFCAEVTARIDAKISTFEMRDKEHAFRYQRVLERLQKIEEQFKSEGKDVSDLSEAIDGLEEKISQVNESHTAFIEALEETQQFDCGKSQGMFKDSSIDAREELAELRAAKLAVQTYFRQTVRPALQNLVQQAERPASGSAQKEDEE